MKQVMVLLICCLRIFILFRFAETDTPDYDYPTGSLSCKLYSTSNLDCSFRDLTTIPLLPANISIVDLSNNKLMNLLDTVFDEQAFLVYVDLQHNWLQLIHGSPFLSLKQLKVLDFSNNLLENLEETSFYGLHKLEHLFLGFNRLQCLHENLFAALTKLQFLDMQSNFLTDIPSQALAQLKSLQELNIYDNLFSTFTLGKGFQNLTNLSKLYLSSLNLVGYENDSLSVTDESSHLFQERYVILDNKTFVNLAHSPIQTFFFFFNLLENVTVIVDNDIFVPLTNLTNLRTFSELQNAVPSAGSHLQTLNIFVNNDDMKLDATSLDFASKVSTSLEHLDLKFSLINGIYGPAFTQFSNLRTLELSGVIYSMQYIADDAFFGLHNLEELYLAHNQINKLPIGALKAFENGTLKLLDLSYNSLTGFFADAYAFSAVSSLTHLNLSCNPILIVAEWIHVLTNLSELKLSSVTSALYIEFSFWVKPLLNLRRLDLNLPDFKDILDGEIFRISKKAPRLEMLTVSGAHVMSLSLISGLNCLRYLDASESFVVLKTLGQLWGKEIYLPQLETLNLAKNRISSIDDMRLNATTPNIVYLDLSNNVIQTFSKDSLQNLQNLQGLNLTGNIIFSLDMSINGLLYLPVIEYLDISRNLLTEIPYAFLERLNGTLKVLSVAGNPFSCTCAIEPFQKWILSNSEVVLLPDYHYRCKTPSQLSGLSITQVELDCKSHLAFYITCGVFSGLACFIMLLIAVKYRWHIKYRLFLFLTWRRYYQPIGDWDNDANVNGIRYDAFVSYAHENERDLTWVVNELRKNIEEGSQPFRLCIGHTRDFIPGAPLLEAITEAIHNSRKTIIVLSPSYLDSEWCYFETQHAWLRLLNEGKDVIILVLLDPIPDAKMTMWLRQFLCKKGYLRWPPDRAGQKLFFRCLRELMKMPTAVNRRYDV